MPVKICKHGLSFLYDEQDADLVARYGWYVHTDSTGCRYVFRSQRYGRRMRMIPLHRAIINAPKGLYVDHINGDTLDNRRANLRIATNSQNQANRIRLKSGTSSRYRGVTWNKASQKWQAGIKCNLKSTHLGLFESEEEAARAYDRAAREMFGSFARPNFEEAA